MSEFNRMTIVAAAEVVSLFNSHNDMEILEVQWGIDGRCRASSKSARVADWSRIAAGEELKVMSTDGLVTMGRALVDTALNAPPRHREAQEWKRLIAGLRFDGYEIIETKDGIESHYPWRTSQRQTVLSLRRMLPEDIPGLDFRESESEVFDLLKRSEFSVAKGHLDQALSAFQRGEWLRNPLILD